MRHQTEYDRLYTDMVRRHEKIIFSVCFFYATKNVLFDDLRQETLISLYRGYRNFKGKCTEATWVYRVCINTCLFAIRRFTDKIDAIPLDDLPGVELKEDNNHEFINKLEWLHGAISMLNPVEKAIILMWLDELSYDDIAANMGIPRNTVASRLHRIKEKLSSKKDI